MKGGGVLSGDGMTTYKVSDDGDLRKYFTQIPNLIDDLGLSVYAYRLYARLKRVAGDDGVCYQSTKTLADACNMSTASVSRAKIELANNNLIKIEEKKTPHGGRESHWITIVDIWAENVASYSQKQQVSTSNLQDSPQKLASYSGEIKEEPIKNNPEEVVQPPPTITISAEAVLNRVTGWASFPGSQLHYRHIIDLMLDTFGEDRTIDELKKQFRNWSMSTTKNGKPYNKLNLTWIDKAQAELAEKPADLTNVNFTELTPEQRDEYIKQKYGELEE